MTDGAGRAGPRVRPWSRVYNRMLVALAIGYGVIAVTILSISPSAGTSDARSEGLTGALSAAAYVALAGATFFAVDRPGRPLAALVAVVLLWDVGDWAGATSTPVALQLVALAAPPLLPVALLSGALRWPGLPSLRTRRALHGMYAGGVVVMGSHLIAYDPFDDPQCRLTCVPASLLWAADPAATHLASAATGVAVVVLSVVATVMLGLAAANAGWTGWGTVGAVYTAAAVAEAGIAVAAAVALRSWDGQTEPWLALFVGRALTILAVGAAMVATGVQALRATRAVRQLGEGLGQPDQLEGSISRALRDPELHVAYWYAEDQLWIDAAGVGVDQPEPGRSITTLARLGDVVARLVHGRSRTPPRDLAQALGPATLLAIDNARLSAVARARLADIRASRQRIVAAGDAVRRRLERDLHDGAQQRLTSVALLLRMARTGADEAATQQRLLLAEQQARKIVVELREIAHGIFPAVLAEEGLAAALFSLVEACPVPVVVEHVEADRYGADVEMAAYAVIDEALGDAATRPRGLPARVAVHESGRELRVDVTDTGCDRVGLSRVADLQEVEDRVGALGGSLAVTGAAGGGTHVCALIPLEAQTVTARSRPSARRS